MNPIAVPLREAARIVPFSYDTLLRATRATDPAAFPPPLKAKRDSKGRILVKVSDLEAWHDSLPDA
jgi:hypothetical protein